MTATPTDDEWTTRRAPHMEKYVELRPVVMEGSPDAHRVMLKVGVQSFWLDEICDTKEEAEWMRDMLCIALDNVVRQWLAALEPAALAAAQAEVKP